MGLFDFLKKKKEPKTADTKPETTTATDGYLGDLEKTGIIYELLEVQPSGRDEKWRAAFLENIVEASFCCGDPQLITGPDGFPYFQLFLPEPGTSFQCYVIDRMKDDFLLSEGFGVVINPQSNSADWVLSYGDILNLKLNKAFYTTEATSFFRQQQNGIISKDEEVLIAQPSEQILPQQVRAIIGDILKANGIKNPKVVMMMQRSKDGKDVTQDLVFNITPHDFSNQEEYNNIMRAVSWYLPRHYSFAGMREETFGNGFQPL